jgi:hypothetical protein
MSQSPVKNEEGSATSKGASVVPMTESSAKKEQSSAAWRRLEFFLPVVLLFLHGMYYNTIGDITALRGVDFGPLLVTPLDHLIPFSVFFIIPYTAIWILPIYMLVRLKRQDNFSETNMRRITLAFLALIIACYTLWIAFPVKMSLRLDHGTLADYGMLGKLTLITYQNATAWNACPSFHVAVPWLICRILKQYTGKLPAAVGWLTVAIFMATVGIRIHYLFDIVGGVMISEAVYRAVLRPCEAANVLQQLSSRVMVAGYTILIVSALGLHRLLLAQLAG